jgi:hypothetical protein
VRLHCSVALCATDPARAEFAVQQRVLTQQHCTGIGESNEGITYTHTCTNALLYHHSMFQCFFSVYLYVCACAYAVCLKHNNNEATAATTKYSNHKVLSLTSGAYDHESWLYLQHTALLRTSNQAYVQYHYYSIYVSDVLNQHYFCRDRGTLVLLLLLCQPLALVCIHAQASQNQCVCVLQCAFTAPKLRAARCRTATGVRSLP